MDVHRSRFIPYPTSAISCLAFTRTHDDANSTRSALRLALARTDGSIEIWNPLNGDWFQETIIPSVHNTTIDSLVWTQEPDGIAYNGDVITGNFRLFSVASGHSSVIEWDIEYGQIKKRSTGNHSEVWCIAPQPRSMIAATRDITAPAQDLLIGCDDGSLVLLTTEDRDVQFRRFLTRGSGKKARCLTVAYQKPEVVVAGFKDGIIRVLDTRNGAVIRTMSLGVGIPGAPKTAMVWKLLSLHNGDIASADSNGELRIWDGRTYSLSHRLSGHERDCLDIVASSDGKTIMSAGVDGRVACYRQVKVDRGRTSWSKTLHRKVNEGNGSVGALAAYDGKGMSVVVAAGSLPSPVAIPLRSFGKENMRTLPFLPQDARVVSAPGARLVATWWNQTIHIYRIARPNSLDVLRDESKTQQLVAKIQLDTTETIRSVAISTAGDLIAAATTMSTKLFQLAGRTAETFLKVRRIQLPDEIERSGSRLLSLTNNEAEGAWLATVSTDNQIRLTKIYWSAPQSHLLEATTECIEVDRITRQDRIVNGVQWYEESISKLVFTADATMLVTGDLAGNLDYFVVEGDFNPDSKTVILSREVDDDDSDSDDEDRDVLLYGQTWKHGTVQLPKLESAPLVLTFRPSIQQNLIDSQLGEEPNPRDQQLIVVTARHQIQEIDIQQGRFSKWSQQYTLPEGFKRIRDRVMGAHWDPKERLWLYGSSFVFMLDVSENARPSWTKRKRQEGVQSPSKRNKRSKDSETSNAAPIAKSTAQDNVANQLLDDNIDDEDNEAALVLAGQGLDGNNDPRLQLQTQKQYWSTFKYRPILGVVELGHSKMSSNDVEEVLEVVIVERPHSSELKK